MYYLFAIVIIHFCHFGQHILNTQYLIFWIPVDRSNPDPVYHLASLHHPLTSPVCQESGAILGRVFMLRISNPQPPSPPSKYVFFEHLDLSGPYHLTSPREKYFQTQYIFEYINP